MQIKSIILLIFLSIFSFNLSLEFFKYQNFIEEEVFETKAQVLNIYEKEDYKILKLQAKDFTFFTRFKKSNIFENIEKLDKISLAIISENISFLSYLKGFFATTLYFDKLETINTSSKRQVLVKKIYDLHTNDMISELYSALFLATTLNLELRNIFASYGISHLIALSGFHLGVLSFLLYYIIYFPYSFVHQRYFPYRNKKFDILLFVIVILFSYLLLTNLVPSLFRAFVMMVFALLLLRFNIKIFSFLNLFLVFLIIIALYPKLIFSLSLWFSLFGVFYILLFVKYFLKIENKILKFIFFNFWIYFAINPIGHYFFTNTSYMQIFSPILSMVFMVFYPFVLFAHLFSFPDILDNFLLRFFYYNFDVYSFKTNIYFLLIYISFSFLSIFYKYAFYFLNILIIFFSIFLFYNKY